MCSERGPDCIQATRNKGSSNESWEEIGDNSLNGRKACKSKLCFTLDWQNKKMDNRFL